MLENRRDRNAEDGNSKQQGGVKIQCGILNFFSSLIKPIFNTFQRFPSSVSVVTYCCFHWESSSGGFVANRGVKV